MPAASRIFLNSPGPLVSTRNLKKKLSSKFQKKTEDKRNRKKTKTNENSNLLSYISKQNRLIIFPSWLVHWVPINKSKRNRISISFNIQIKGQVGEQHEFQSAEY